MVRVAKHTNGADPTGSRRLRHRSSYGYAPLARFGLEQRTVPIVVFRSGTGGGFLPRRVGGAVKPRGLDGRNLCVHTSDSRGLAAPRRADRRVVDCECYMACGPSANHLCLRPYTLCRTYDRALDCHWLRSGTNQDRTLRCYGRTEMKASLSYVDGNAAGELNTIFAVDITKAKGQCANCGA